jgi:hypothetical protein
MQVLAADTSKRYSALELFQSYHPWRLGKTEEVYRGGMANTHRDDNTKLKLEAITVLIPASNQLGDCGYMWEAAWVIHAVRRAHVTCTTA